jgi:hypothetical protein
MSLVQVKQMQQKGQIKMDDFNQTKVKNIPEEEFFTLYGQEDFLDNDNNPRCNSVTSDKVFAKRSFRNDGSTKYSIKLDNNGKIYNPTSIYGNAKTSSFLDRVCRSQNKFKEVNQKAFDMYIKFLKTKNLAWFHNTEREV